MSLMEITGKRQGSVIIDFKIYQEDTDLTLDELDNEIEKVLKGDIGYPVLPLKQPAPAPESVQEAEEEPDQEIIKPDD